MHKCGTMINIGAPYFVKRLQMCATWQRKGNVQNKKNIRKTSREEWVCEESWEIRLGRGAPQQLFPVFLSLFQWLALCWDVRGGAWGVAGGFFGSWWSGIWPGNQRELPPYKGFPVVKLIVRDSNCRVDLFRHHAFMKLCCHTSWLQLTRDEKVDFINNQNDASVGLSSWRGSLIWFPLWVLDSRAQTVVFSRI